MILKIIDTNLNEYQFNEFDINYGFSFHIFPVATAAQCALVLSNVKDISIEEKVKIFNLFSTLQSIDIKDVIIENSDYIDENNSYLVLFNSNFYNLLFKELRYNSAYQNHETSQGDKYFETIEISFYFNREE